MNKPDHKEDILTLLEKRYDEITKNEFDNDYLKSIQKFEDITEGKLRNLLDSFYKTHTSKDQAWKVFKGKLYEYAVYRCIQQSLIKNKLNEIFCIVKGEEVLVPKYREQIGISNWNYIFPDIDLAIINKKSNEIAAIISCKTSLRERLTETAFWKRELEKVKKNVKFKIIFITTNKDNELQTETNRYIIFHVIDCTFITDLKKYERLIEDYKRKYGNREDFDKLIKKVRFISEISKYFSEELLLK